MGQLWSTWGYFTTSPLSSISIPGGQRNMWLSVAMVDWCLLTLKELGIHSWFSHKVYQVTYDTSWNWCSRFVSEAHSKGKTIFNCRLCCPDENAGRKCTIFSQYSRPSSIFYLQQISNSQTFIYSRNEQFVARSWVFYQTRYAEKIVYTSLQSKFLNMNKSIFKSASSSLAILEVVQ